MNTLKMKPLIMWASLFVIVCIEFAIIHDSFAEAGRVSTVDSPCSVFINELECKQAIKGTKENG